MYAGLAQLAARQSHNLKVVSSNLTFRIIFICHPIKNSSVTEHANISRGTRATLCTLKLVAVTKS